MLKKVISGAQDGADLAGLDVALAFGLETGGTMPFGYKTLSGPKPKYKEKYGLETHKSSSYAPRTKLNVKNSDGTIRLAFDLESAGEICTLKAIRQYDKPNFDVDLNSPPPVEEAAQWFEENNIEVLNVAGNARVPTYERASEYLSQLFGYMGLKKN